LFGWEDGLLGGESRFCGQENGNSCFYIVIFCELDSRTGSCEKGGFVVKADGERMGGGEKGGE